MKPAALVAMLFAAALSLSQALLIWTVTDIKADVRELRGVVFKLAESQGYSVTMRGNK